MASALIIGDVHLSDKPPSSRKLTYKDEIFDKLRFCVERANELNVPIVQAGDIFHIKSASKNSHRLVQQTHDILSQTYNGVWVVPGNHDLSHDRLDSLDGQPLGALCRMKNVELLIGETIDLPGIAGVPYITEFDGGSWQHVLRDYWEDFGITEPELLITHAPIFPDGKEPGVYASISASVFAEYFVGVPATYYGHIHDPEWKFMDKSELMLFANAGAISRGSLHEKTINRKPHYTLWDGSDFTFHEIPCKEPEEVFLFDVAATKAANKASAQDFAAALGTTKLSTLTLEDVYARLRSEVSDRKVLELIEDILEDVQDGC